MKTTKKMSKSANNGIDPLVLINKYGTDALRYTLIREVAGAGQDIRLEYNRKTDESASVEASRNFTNKLWNAARFVMLNLDGKTPQELGIPALENLELADRWILSRYNQVVQTTRSDLDKYGFGEAAKELYEFIWGDFCDWYIELVKPRLYEDEATPSKQTAQQTLALVLDGILKLLHPFMPHITEEIWHTLNQAGEGEFLAVQPYPTALPDLIDNGLEQQFDLLFNTVRTVRNLRAEAGIKPSTKIETILETENPEERNILQATADYIKDLGTIETLTIRGGQVHHQAEPKASAAAAAAQTAQARPNALPTPNPVVTEVKDFWTTMRPLLEAPLEYLGSFFTDVRRPAITLLWIGAGAVSLKLAIALVDAVDDVPVFGSLMELTGIWFTYRFVSKNLLTSRDRSQLVEKYKAWQSDIFGQHRLRQIEPRTQKAIKAAPAQPRLEPAAEAVTSVQALPQAGDTVPQTKMFAGVVGTIQVLIPLTGVVDVDALKAKLEKDLGKIEAEIKSLSGRLSNPGFVEKAPADVVQGARDALAEAETQADILRSRLNML